MIQNTFLHERYGVEGNCARDMVGKGKEPQYFRVSDCSRAITDAKIYKLVPC